LLWGGKVKIQEEMAALNVIVCGCLKESKNKKWCREIYMRHLKVKNGDAGSFENVRK